jgi:hypothetical protein
MWTGDPTDLRTDERKREDYIEKTLTKFETMRGQIQKNQQYMDNDGTWSLDGVEKAIELLSDGSKKDKFKERLNKIITAKPSSDKSEKPSSDKSEKDYWDFGQSGTPYDEFQKTGKLRTNEDIGGNKKKDKIESQLKDYEEELPTKEQLSSLSKEVSKYDGPEKSDFEKRIDKLGFYVFGDEEDEWDK